MWQWLPKRLSHNTTISKLQPSLLKSGRPLWLVSFIGSFAVFGISYSIHGFVQDIFPNLSIIKKDRERLLIKKNAFDLLVMGHSDPQGIEKCQFKSLF